jgi:hypothetical protein
MTNNDVHRFIDIALHASWCDTHPVNRVVLPLLFVVACATGAARPANIIRPEIEFEANGTPFFGSGFTAPLDVDATVTNRSNAPVMIHSIRVTSPGMIQFTVRPIQRLIRQTLAAGETKTFVIPLTLLASSAGIRPTEPLNLRAEVDFIVDEKHYRDIYLVNLAF